MQPEKKTSKPTLPSSTIKKPQDSFKTKIAKIQLFYRYRLPSIYRQLKKPIYQTLLSNTKITHPLDQKNHHRNIQTPKIKTQQQDIQTVYKKVMLNSKYHHRQKMRFSRTPLLKYLKYNFNQLQQKLKQKQYSSLYDDLKDSDEDDDQKQDKKQYEVDSTFSSQALLRYKKKNNISGKIICTQGYDDLKNRLIEHYGWTQNPDPTSLMYDYKHMSKKKDIDYINLLQDQLINHFHENKSITAKFGLVKNIRNICSLGKDPSIFFPRCFDVNDVSQLENFYVNFKITYVQSIINKFVNYYGLVHYKQYSLYYQIIQKCLQILQRDRLTTQKKIQLISKNQIIIITQPQWDLITKYQKLQPTQTETSQNKFPDEFLKKAKILCEQGQNYDPQWKLNKDNIWIVKPASMSRGRGIKTFNKINEILDYIIGKQISWVVQKYIENPLIIKKKKFDIRQWVLLTDFKPFRVWIYEECYIRFCASLYTPSNLKDRKVHLTNNSVTKGLSDIVDDGIHENMLSEAEFAQLLKQMESGRDIMKQLIKPQITQIAIQALQSVKQNIIPRKNTLQIFGFDFMIDENYKVWLIQVNSSPTMQYSTKITAQIVKKGMSQLADLVNNYMCKGKYYDKNKSRQLYGGWILLT